MKTRGALFRADAAVFFIRTEDELGVLQSSGGRSVYENIGATQREGAELGVTADLPGQLRGAHRLFLPAAVVADAYAGCAGTPCTADVIPAGNYLPAIPQNILYAGLTWRYPAAGFFATAETLVRSRIYADDRNTGYAGGYWTENLRAGFEQKSPAGRPASTCASRTCSTRPTSAPSSSTTRIRGSLNRSRVLVCS